MSISKSISIPGFLAFLGCGLSLGATAAQAGTASISIDAGQMGPRIPKSLYGVFLEEISHAGEGGLYAELVQNRGFEDANIPPGCHLENGFLIPPRTPHFWENRPVDWKLPWKVTSPYPGWRLESGAGNTVTAGLVTTQPLNAATPHSMQVAISKVAPGGSVSLINEGFWGIGVKEKAAYNLSFYARAGAGFKGPIKVSLVSADGKVLASQIVQSKAGPQWRKVSAKLTATATDPKAHLAFSFGSTGIVNLDFVSLFPAQTFKNRPNGLRPDIAKMIADLKPGFVRWPGGCVVEGITIETRPQWKQTIGPIEERIPTFSPWEYWTTNGMGYHEYLQFCEDIGADALYVANVGVSCAFRSGTYLPDDQVPALIQDSLDAIEYAIGPVTSRWGALRAKNGHPAPFPLKYFEVGNEQSGPRYGARVKQFNTAIKAKYPQLKVALSSWIAGIDQAAIDAAGRVDIVDEHAYKPLHWPVTNFDSFASYSRDVPWELYIGEFATNGNVGSGNLHATLNDAAYMMSMEKNSDLVKMGSYAPLLENINDTDWNVNMIHFDSSRLFGRATYYACKMFVDDLPDVNLKTSFNYTPSRPLAVGGGIGLGTWDTSAEFKDVKVESDGQVVYTSDFAQGLNGWRKDGEGNWITQDGVLRQDQKKIGFAYLDKPDLKNATITLKARRIEGPEGFLVVLGNAEGQQVRLNFGGWGNSQHAVQVAENIAGTAVRGSIEAGRWYDVKVQADGDTVRAWLDGQLVQTVKMPRTDVVLAIAGRDEKNGDIIVKAVNTSAEPAPTRFNITGAPGLKPEGEWSLLTSDNPNDENSFENPTKIVPRKMALKGVAPSFSQTLPPYSLSIMRLKTR
jgi:alpha-L-arabinofuranosidase